MLDPYATHIPVLAAVITATKGPVLECGAGFYSTPLLHALCRNRRLVTVETEARWAREFKIFEDEKHEFVICLDLAPIVELWDVVFVDGKSWERVPVFQKLRKFARFFVVHDTENVELYQMEPELKQFANRLDFKMPKLAVQTTLVSDESLDAFKGILP
jgi:hypothetical protein